MNYDAERGALLAEVVKEKEPGAQLKKMFGHETWFLNTYMFAGANTDGIWVHLGEEKVQECLEQQESVAPFSPGRGMIMKDYLLVADPVAKDREQITNWVQQSTDYLKALPPKVKKAKKKTKTSK